MVIFYIIYKFSFGYNMVTIVFTSTVFAVYPSNSVMPASVAHLDRRPTGDQEVAGSTPARLATFFYGDWSWHIFYGHSLPSADLRRAIVSFWQKNVHNTG